MLKGHLLKRGVKETKGQVARHPKARVPRPKGGLRGLGLTVCQRRPGWVTHLGSDPGGALSVRDPAELSNR